MEAIKLNLHKFDGAIISDGYLCIPVPDEGTGAKGLWQGKNGAVYASATIFKNTDENDNDVDDDYGNHSCIRMSYSKAEKEEGLKPEYIGNIKTVVFD